MPNRTKALIKGIFLQLLAETSFDKITVTDIVQACGINRNTFYYHYQDIYALTDEILEDEIFQLRTDTLSHDTLTESFMEAIHIVREQKRSVYHLYRSEYKEKMIQFLYRTIKGSIERYFEVLKGDLDIDSEAITIMERFYSHGLVGTVTDWLNANMDYDLETYIKRTMDIFQDSPRRLLESTAERQKQSVPQSEQEKA